MNQPKAKTRPEMKIGHSTRLPNIREDWQVRATDQDRDDSSQSLRDDGRPESEDEGIDDDFPEFGMTEESSEIREGEDLPAS